LQVLVIYVTIRPLSGPGTNQEGKPVSEETDRRLRILCFGGFSTADAGAHNYV
jgi:hypothetical protein